MDTATDRGLTIKEAAARLGITDVAVRKRLVRGKLPGHKDETGQWFVHLPDHLPEAEKKPAADTPRVSAPGSVQVIARLEDEVRYLRDELRLEREARGEELRRKDFILAQFAERLPELPAPPPSPDEQQRAPSQWARSWWRFWEWESPTP